MVLTYFCPWTLNLHIAIVLLHLRVHYSVEIKRYKSGIRIRTIFYNVLLGTLQAVLETCGTPYSPMYFHTSARNNCIQWHSLLSVATQHRSLNSSKFQPNIDDFKFCRISVGGPIISLSILLLFLLILLFSPSLCLK